MVTQALNSGILSLIIWALIVVVTLKYVLILLRADNHGEGGTLALMALAIGPLAAKAPCLLGMVRVGVLWRCDDHPGAVGVVGGRRTDSWRRRSGAYVLPLTVVILSRFSGAVGGTARVATFFGPITLVWFVVIALAVADVSHSQNPGRLQSDTE